jgi:alpha-galactosidase
MPRVKLSVIGAGSFVFGPSVLAQAFCENRQDGLEISLHDLDHESIQLMARIGERMARQHGVDSIVTHTTDRKKSLEGASFVIHSAAPQLISRYLRDCDIVERLAPGEYLGEFGGINGISYTARQVALVESIVADMKEVCPDAWLFCVANPMPRVVQAAQQLGIRSVGFCSASSEGFDFLWRIFENRPEPYPWPRARQRWRTRMAGLNHFSWLVELRDRTTGTDLYPTLREKIAAGATAGNPWCESFVGETGYLLLPNDHHIKDFLPPRGPSHRRYTPAHGTAEERQERMEILRQTADGERPWIHLVEHPSWERTLDLVGALAFGREACFNSLNLSNTGQIPSLPQGVFVETSASAGADGIHPDTIDLPETVQALTRQTARVTDAMVRATLGRSKKLLREVVELDPTILNKEAAYQAVLACLEEHCDLVPAYS